MATCWATLPVASVFSVALSEGNPWEWTMWASLGCGMQHYIGIFGQICSLHPGLCCCIWLDSTDIPCLVYCYMIERQQFSDVQLLPYEFYFRNLLLISLSIISNKNGDTYQQKWPSI